MGKLNNQDKIIALVKIKAISIDFTDYGPGGGMTGGEFDDLKNTGNIVYGEVMCRHCGRYWGYEEVIEADDHDSWLPYSPQIKFGEVVRHFSKNHEEILVFAMLRKGGK